MSISHRLAIAAVALVLAGCAGTVPSAAPTSPPSPGDEGPTPSPARPVSTPSPSAPASTPSGGLVQRIASSRYPYAIAVPVSWTTEEMGAADLYSNSNGDQLDVRFYMAIADDADTWFGKATDLLSGFAEIEDERPVTVAGNEGRQYELHPSQDGRDLFLIRAVLIGGGDAWDVTWVSEAGNEAADRTRFETMLSSFERVAAFRNVWGLEVGSCFDSLPLAPDRDGGASILFVGPVDGFALADCGQPHTGEVIAALGPETDSCDAAFEPFIGRPLAGSDYTLLEFMPLVETDLPPGIARLCVVTDSSGVSSGSARGSAR